MYLADIQLANPSTNQLGILGTEIKNKDFFHEWK